MTEDENGCRSRRRKDHEAIVAAEASPETANSLEEILQKVLGATEDETAALEALDEYYATGDEDAWDRAAKLLGDSLERLKKAQRELDDLLASCKISHEYWKAITEQIRSARKYDNRARSQLHDDYEGVREPRKWIRVAVHYKDTAIAFLKHLRAEAAKGS